MLLRPPLFAALALVAAVAGCAKDPAAPAAPPPEGADQDAVVEDDEAKPTGLVEDATPRAAPLAVGDPAPAFTLTDAQGESFSLASQLESGPVIAIFYRGHW